MAGPNCQAGRGKDGTAAILGQAWLLWKGEGKEVSALVVWGCLRAREFV
jgi:hypothetical protein